MAWLADESTDDVCDFLHDLRDLDDDTDDSNSVQEIRQDLQCKISATQVHPDRQAHISTPTPMGTIDTSAPRSRNNARAPRSQNNARAPRSQDNARAPRSQDNTRAPRSQDNKRSRSQDNRRPRNNQAGRSEDQGLPRVQRRNREESSYQPNLYQQFGDLLERLLVLTSHLPLDKSMCAPQLDYLVGRWGLHQIANTTSTLSHFMYDLAELAAPPRPRFGQVYSDHTPGFTVHNMGRQYEREASQNPEGSWTNVVDHP